MFGNDLYFDKAYRERNYREEYSMKYRYNNINIYETITEKIRREDIRLPESLDGILRRIFAEAEDDELSPMDASDKSAEHNKNISQDKLNVNTFPFGIPTDRVFTEFFGLCLGETKFREALDAIVKYCEATKYFYSEDTLKTVLLITDKWHYGIFNARYENRFVNYAVQNNIKFIFLQVSNYGASIIPFLPIIPYEFDKFRQQYYYRPLQFVTNNLYRCFDKVIIFKADFEDFLFENRNCSGLRNNKAAKELFNTILAQEENIIQMIGYSELGKPALAACIKKVEAWHDQTGQEEFPLSGDGSKFNKSAVGLMIKTILAPFGYAVTGNKKISSECESKYFTSAACYQKQNAGGYFVCKSIEIVDKAEEEF